MKIKLAYSPLWMGVVGAGITGIVFLFMTPRVAAFWGWWLSQGSLILLFLVGALVHGHFKWKRRQCFQQRVKDAGLKGRRVIDLGGNAIGVVENKGEKMKSVVEHSNKGEKMKSVVLFLFISTILIENLK
jgi:predicted tellurium resistance membrane protein TerC